MCMSQIIAINTPLARGRMIALNAVMKAMGRAISNAVLSRPSSNIQKTKGMLRWPAIRIVTHAGPSSARKGS